MEFQDQKCNSLRWAIDELSKQKDELSSKLCVARKREDTNSLIDEVNAQKVALEKRISSLEDGFKASAELVNEPLGLLEEELSKVDDKLEIAQDRLNTLEQEEYLEKLGRKLNGDFSEDDLDSKSGSASSHAPSTLPSSLEDAVLTTELKSSESVTSSQNFSPPTPILMKAPANRIETEEETSGETITRVSDTEVAPKEAKPEQCSPSAVQNLEECANALGIEPDFLLNKGLQAVLRMIARNGNKISFPLEVEQVDKT